jgi:hypothetical protein
MHRSSALAAVALVLACSCAPGPGSQAGPTPVLRVDGRTDATLNASLDAMRADMTREEISEFTDAIVRIASEDSVRTLREANGNADVLNDAVRQRFDGMTADEILAQGAEKR